MTSQIEENEEVDRPWEILNDLIERSDAGALASQIDSMSAEQQRFAMSHMSGEMQSALIELLSAVDAAHLLEHLPEAQAVDILEEIPPAAAADIVESLPDDVGVDLLREMSEADTEAVLAELDDRKEAESLRERTEYEWDTAGGLMTQAYAVFDSGLAVGQVISQLGEQAEKYEDMDVQYVYVTGAGGQLLGVLRLRDLVLARRERSVKDVMICDPVSVSSESDYDFLREVFDEKNYIGLPVIDPDGTLVGVVTKQAVEEAIAEHQTEDYLHSSGIVGGEELRSMPMFQRSRRRLAWLGPNIILNLIAASVIARYESTLEAVIALAIFLPIVSDMSGCSGNQAVAVSIRELTMGLIRPNEFLRILWKEGVLGLMNGLVLGIALGTVAGVWQGNAWLGLVIGGALALNTILSVILGGSVPLLLKRFGVDPAIAAGPILTTCTDMCGFFLVLNLASLILTKLV